MATKKKKNTATSPIAFHIRVRERIERYGISKSKMAKDIQLSRPTLDVWLRDGLIGNVGGHGEKHDLSSEQKRTIREKYMR